MVAKHKLVALQEVQWWYDKEIPGEKGYKMLATDECLSALLVMFMHQFSDEPTFIGEDADTDICKAMRTLNSSGIRCC